MDNSITSGSTSNHPGVSRRGALTVGGAAAIAGMIGTSPAVGAPGGSGKSKEIPLKFNSDGRFKVVQFNDTQDTHRTDKRTIELMERTLDSEKPDFALINGDVITGGMTTELQVMQALNHVVFPMEDRGIPWAITFGNHDEDSMAQTGMDEPRMLRFVQSYGHNLNQTDPDDLTGTGNGNLLIRSSRGIGPAFNLWLIDGGRYAPDKIAGQNFEGYPGWDWIRADQVSWYRDQSARLEKQYGMKVPSLMFFHIALWEHRFMWFSSVDSRTDADHERAMEKHQIVGERNEDECPGPFNSGMYSALQERGDVKGVFVGHDHINTYVGDYYGIQLGYGPGTGFAPYGLGDATKNNLRGARIFELDESHPGVLKDSRLIFAKDFDIDLSPSGQPLEDPHRLDRVQLDYRSR
ncbi:metallophosphoesterase family protein [Arthrobacter sp. H5]|uniref:metallophosphoesterase family protein n=1 Tax=Arthrobacter sp. H5 TaxID=1267973 RepID=UPI0004B60F72|nr:metallophosphoesterase family protein [Arthrobacter sp. H5]